MPFYKVPPASSAVASSSAPFATKYPSTNYSNSIAGQSVAVSADDITWGDSSDRSVSSGGGGGGGGFGNLVELTEADRDSELLRRDLEHRVQLSQADRKNMDQVNGNMASFASASIRRRTNDVIEEELIAQHRREEELASTRQFVCHQQKQSAAEEDNGSESPSCASSANYDSSSDGPVASEYAHPGESRIVQELMEQRRRELELRGRWKEMGFVVPEETNHNETPFTLPEPKPMNHKEATSRRDDRETSASDADSSREITEDAVPKGVRPYEDPDIESERKLAYIPANETPIEREIRLAHEREDALRQDHGLLPLAADPQRRETKNVEIEVTSSNGSYHVGDPSVKDTMKKLASNRLQLELLKEKERELALRSQGAIHTISEERAGKTVKYVEIIPKQVAESPAPTLFKSLHGSTQPAEAKQMVAGGANHTLEGKQVVVEMKTPEPVAVNGRVRHSLPGQSVEHVNELEAVFGGRLQKQQEPMMLLRQKSATSKPTAAERKILNELKDMQMRENELKCLRESMQLSSSPSDSFDTNPSTDD